MPRVFPVRVYGRLRPLATQVARHLCEIAPRFDTNLGRDQSNDADDLRLRCKPVWIEAIGRPGKVVVHAVEAEAEEMLNLLCWAPPVPAGRLVGAGDGRQARDGYDVAVLIHGSGLP